MASLGATPHGRTVTFAALVLCLEIKFLSSPALQPGCRSAESLFAVNRNDHASGDYQRTAEQDWQCGRLTESYAGDNLRQKKE